MRICRAGACSRRLKYEKDRLYKMNADAAKFFHACLMQNTPGAKEALAYFHEYSKLRNHALKEYSKYYGPLTIDTTMESCTDRWNWINEPWPWQEGGC